MPSRDPNDEDYQAHDPLQKTRDDSTWTNNFFNIIVVACLASIIVAITIRVVTWILP